MDRLVIKPNEKFLNDFNLKNSKIEAIYLDGSSAILEASIIDVGGFSELLSVENALKEKFDNNLSLNYKLNFSTNDSIKEIIKHIVDVMKKDSVTAKLYLDKFDFRLENDTIFLGLKDNTSIERVTKSNFHIEIIKRLKEKFSLDYKILLEQTTVNLEDFEKDLKMQLDSIEIKDIKVEKSKIILGKDIRKKAISIEEVYELENDSDVVTQGKVFNYKLLKSKSGRGVLSFNITNLKNSLGVKAFIEEKKLNLKDDMLVKIRGKKIIDDYNEGEVVVLVSDIVEEIFINEEKKDLAEEKRVELHAHTKMSELDSIIEINDLIDRAVSYGHRAVAITDGGVVYSFPYAYDYAKKFKDFKLILGVEGYVVDDQSPYLEHIKEGSIEKETFVVFDIETTGFNPYKDKIIEIAAVKVSNKEIIDTYSTFINPEVEIPKIITDLTGINNEMVKNAPKIEDIFDKFVEFSKGSILVAHNADFDIGFMTQQAIKLKKDFDFSSIDNLKIARNVLTSLKKHGLKDLAKHFGFEFNHHRALDDARVTAKIFIEILKLVMDRGAVKFEDIDSSNILNSFPFNSLILVKNAQGLKNLYELVSVAHLEGFKRIPKIPKSLLNKKRDGLIIGSCMDLGELTSNYLRGASKKDLLEIIKFYDFVEITPPETLFHLFQDNYVAKFEDIEGIIKEIVNLCEEVGVKIVGTGNVKYLNELENKYREILLYGKGEKLFNTNRKLYFRTTDQMLKDFSFLGDEKSYEIVVKNSNFFADEVEKIKPIPDGFYPPKIEGAEEEVKKLTYEKAYQVYGNPLPEIVENRIKRELESIINNGFAVLYLIAHKLVKKSLEDGYTVGSRGSVGSSLVAWLMNITEVNALYPHYICFNCKYTEFMEFEGSGVDLPEKKCPKCSANLVREGHSIPFEVFMGFKGEKVPDIDLNFSGEYQPIVHKYVEELFGTENVFRAGTISTLAKKNAFGYVRKYVEENNIKMPKAHMEYLAFKCENVRKTTGQHPGGMIVLPHDKSIYEFTPIQKPANDITAGHTTTHFDYHVMDAQLVKLDILGHDDPTTVKILKDFSGLDPLSIPLNDPKTISIFSSTEALGVKAEDINSPTGAFGLPEFGTPFVRRMLAETRPKTFAELVRISGLSHGTDVWTNNAQDLVKKGIAKISEVISVRDDIMNYLIDKKIDKAIAFKIMEFVRKGLPLKDENQWAEYTKLMKQHGVPDWYINSCQKIIYMFPKGHAVAYVIMAVRIAYYKVHKPVEFYAAFLTRKLEFFDFDLYIKRDINAIKKKIDELYAQPSLDVREKNELSVFEIMVEMFYRGIELLPIDLYKSDASKFTPENGKVRIPFASMKGLGEAVAENIVNERVKEFLSFEDLRKRTRLSKTLSERIKELNLFKLQELNQRTLF